MGESEQGADTKFNDDLPDFTPPQWEAKFAKATVHPDEPIDLHSARVTRGPDGYIFVSHKRCPERGAEGC